jgi:multidomain signaling protein FimX
MAASAPAEFCALVARGTRRDLRAWAASVIAKVKRTLFEAGGKSVSISISAGIAVADRRGMPLDLLSRAKPATRCPRARAGAGQVGMSRHEEDSTRMEELDQIWVKRIKRALLDNRFRLADQPIACLTGEDKDLHDLFVRMIDEQGDEVLPAQFMEAAERNKLIKNIDRWVIGAALVFHGASRPTVFVRLSKDTMLDSMLPAWLETRRKNARLPEGVIVFQVVRGSRGEPPEADARHGDPGCARSASASRRGLHRQARPAHARCSPTCRWTT